MQKQICNYVIYCGLSAILILSGCLNDPTAPDTTGDNGKLFVVESDYQSGQLEWIDIENNTIQSGNISIYSDAAVRTFGGYLYILERFGADNIIKFDPSASDESGVIYQQHLGDNRNPVDIDFVSETKAYIANNNEATITVFNPSTHTVIKEIDISQYTFNPDSNSSPNAGQMVIANSMLYVMLQRRDGWNPGAPTLILTINTSTDLIAALDTIAFQYKNGYDMVHYNGVLYASNPGSAFATGDGAIEAVTLSTKVVSTIITEDALGGNPNLITHKEGTLFYVQTYIGWKNVKVIEVDFGTGAVVGTLPGVKDAFGGIFYDSTDQRLYVGERDSVEMGIRIFENNLQVGSTIKSGNSLPPNGMVVVR